MFQVGTGFYVRDNVEQEKRILHPATVTATSDTTLVACLQDDRLSLAPNSTITIYYDHHGEFMQLSVRVCSVTPSLGSDEGDGSETNDEPAPYGCSFVFEPIGQSCSAESRETFRVCTALGEMTTAVGEDENCALVDISSTGISVITKQSLAIDAVVPVVLRFQGKRFAGHAVVKSTRKLSRGRTRYGLHFLTSKENCEIARGAHYVVATLQQQHLQRLSASA